MKALKRFRALKMRRCFLSVNADVKEKSGDGAALTVTENADVSGMMLISGGKYSKDDTDGVWLSDK